MNSNIDIFERYKRDTMKIARQLFYTDSTIRAIRDANTEAEVLRIMHDARERGEKR